MKKKYQDIKQIANCIRQDVITMLVTAGSGHIAGSLGMADVFTALYLGGIARHDPRRPQWKNRDRVVVSNGHICPVWYATLARSGYFAMQELKTLRQLGSRLQGHPHRGSLPGIENTSGPLGQGVSVAVGLALAAKMDSASWRVFCIISDGELNEGQTWEACMLAHKYHLGNLVFLCDRNTIQIDGCTEDVMPLEPLREKFEAFGLYVIEADGHNIAHIIDACNTAKSVLDKPTMIICHTIPGKGVEFMQGKYQWHGKSLNEKEGRQALRALRSLGGRIDYEV